MSLLGAVNTKTRDAPAPLDGLLPFKVKQEPWTDDEPAHSKEQNNCQTAAEKTTPDDYQVAEVKEESFDLVIVEETEFKYGLTCNLPSDCNER